MGNRAVITTNEKRPNKLGIYIHWNGDPRSVKAFLTYAKMRGFRCPENDCYGWARLAQVIANFMGKEGLSVGIDVVDRLDCDNWDNGVYVIENWEIVGREYASKDEQVDDDITGMILEIDRCQPQDQQIGAGVIYEMMKGA